MKHETEEKKKPEIPFGTKVAIWGKFTVVALIAALTIQGAVSMTQKQWVQVAMGSQAMASEQVVISETETATPVVANVSTTEDIAIPQALDEPSDGKARCLGNARNETQKTHCHELFATKSNTKFSEVY